MGMRIPLVDLEALHRPLRSEILDVVTRCLDSQKFLLGEETEKLEQAIAELSGVSFAVACSSGTDALLMCLMALEVGPGDEIVTSAFSFFATAGVISRLGATPVFADIDDRSFNVDPARVAERLTGRTKAILPVHLYGRAAEMTPMLDLATSRGITVVEDAAQALGATDGEGRPTGSMGRAASFSFYPSKNLGAMGDAGMVVSNDEALARTLKRLRVHGESDTYRHEIVGGNFRIDAIQSAILNVKLRHLAEWNRKRRERANRYDRLFAESGLVEKGIVRTPEPSPGHIYHQYVIRVEEREALRGWLQEAGIATGVYYPIPLHLQPCFRDLGYGEGDFPFAERAAKESLALPIYPSLSERGQSDVVTSMASFYGRS
jgi:dTDP-4-amino-4,6-dideoxygalactose transaminase